MRRYGVWAANPRGLEEDEDCCVVEVPDSGRSVLFHQCERKRGHGPDGLYCKQHARMLESWRELSVPEDK